MLKPWPTTIFIIAFILTAIIKIDERKHLQVYRRAMPSLQLRLFDEARAQVKKSELPKLALWESMLTGRTRSLPADWKTTFRELGLAHIFTPSGFHLSAVLVPLTSLSLLKAYKTPLIVLILSMIVFFCQQPALRRMALVKLSQRHWGRIGGFIFALILDLVLGSFASAPLGFTFSFLFLGIIYARSGSVERLLHLFLAQSLICYFTTGLISPLLLVLNPLLNLAFGLCLPVLVVLSFPLWDWQLHLGLMVVGALLEIVNFAAVFVHALPIIELSIFFVFLLRGRRWVPVVLILSAAGLNDPRVELPSQSTYAIVTGNCKSELLGGVWLKTCSLRRGSRRKKA